MLSSLPDLLDDFHKPMLPPKPTAPDPAKKEPKVGGKEDGDGSPESGALSQELEAGMAELLSGLDDSVGAWPVTEDPEAVPI